MLALAVNKNTVIIVVNFLFLGQLGLINMGGVLDRTKIIRGMPRWNFRLSLVLGARAGPN